MGGGAIMSRGQFDMKSLRSCLADNYRLINDVREWLEAIRGLLAATHGDALMNCVIALSYSARSRYSILTTITLIFSIDGRWHQEETRL